MTDVGKSFMITIWHKNIVNLYGLSLDDPKNYDEIVTRLSTTLNKLGKFYGAICNSANDRVHIHVLLLCQKTKRLKTLAKELGDAHVELRRGSNEQAVAYINKEGEYGEKEEEVLIKFGDEEIRGISSGYRTDLEAIALQYGDLSVQEVRVASFDKSIDRQIALERVAYAQKHKSAKRKKDEMLVVYIEGDSDSGKSFPLKQLMTKNPDLIYRGSCLKRDSFPLDGYAGEDILWLEEFRPGTFDDGYLFTLLDDGLVSVNIKFGRTYLTSNIIVATSAMDLDKWYRPDLFRESGTVGEESIEVKREQFMRRFNYKIRALGESENYEYEIYKAVKDKKDKKSVTRFVFVTRCNEVRLQHLLQSRSEFDEFCNEVRGNTAPNLTDETPMLPIKKDVAGQWELCEKNPFDEEMEAIITS